MTFGQTHSKGFNFGLDKVRIVAELRRLAAEIEDDRILPQEISRTTSNQGDDFEFVTLELTYAEPAQG